MSKKYHTDNSEDKPILDDTEHPELQDSLDEVQVNNPQNPLDKPEDEPVIKTTSLDFTDEPKVNLSKDNDMFDRSDIPKDEIFNNNSDPLDLTDKKKASEHIDPLDLSELTDNNENINNANDAIVTTPNENPAPQTSKNKADKKEKAPTPIIIKRIKKHQGHHGGAWKIAFADFVTAMMAFFLLMWLLAALNKAQKEGVADYFKQPIKVAILGGNSMGDRKESLQGGGADITQKDGLTANTSKPPLKKSPADAVAKETEMKQLQNIKTQLDQTMEKDPAYMGLKKQLVMDITKDGLRIQLVDDQTKPMFELGKDAMNPEMQQVLKKIVLLLKDSPNKITLQGHTDANPYDNPKELQTSNWELSTQRANAARRALVNAGLNDNKIMRVTGYASTLLFDKTNPFNPRNRRISIIVMKKEAEQNVLMDN